MVEKDRPTAAGVYQALLQGPYASGADKERAAFLVSLVPTMPIAARAQRDGLRAVAARINASGISQVVDLGSGYPTDDHLHALCGPDVRVIYCDNDHKTANIGGRLIKNHERAFMVTGDLTDLPTLLKRLERDGLTDFDSPVFLSLWGVSCFLDDATIASISSEAYRWLVEGSRFAFHLQLPTMNEQHPGMRQLLSHYSDELSSPCRMRSRADCCRLLAPWKCAESDFVPVFDLLHDSAIRSEYNQLAYAYGPEGVGSCAFLSK